MNMEDTVMVDASMISDLGMNTRKRFSPHVWIIIQLLHSIGAGWKPSG